MALKNGRPVVNTNTILLGNVFPSGLITPFGGGEIPSGWLLCDGSEVSREEYSELFKVLGTAHGEGDGETTFRLPDIRGRFVRGVDMGVGRDGDASNRTADAEGGNEGDSVGSIQDDTFQLHGHKLVYNQAGAAGPIFGAITASGHPDYASDTEGGQTHWFAKQPVKIFGGEEPRTSNETRPKNINTHYIIKV